MIHKRKGIPAPWLGATVWPLHDHYILSPLVTRQTMESVWTHHGLAMDSPKRIPTGYLEEYQRIFITFKLVHIMAKLLPNNKIIGSIGNVSFRGFTEGTILQSKPGKGGVKQTKNTKKSASNFGRCSSAAALMVRSWQSIILQYQDAQMAYKFRSALYHSMLAHPLPPGSHRSLQHATLSDLNGFEFNSHTPFATYCSIPIHISLTANNVMQLTVESCNAANVVQWPANAQKATLCLLVNNPFVPTTKTNSQMVQLPIANSNASIDEQTFEIELAPHTPAVAVTACLLYYNAMLHHTPVCLNHKQLHPAALLYCDTIA